MQSRSGPAAAHRLCAPAPGPRPATLGLGDTSVIPLKTERRAERSPQQHKRVPARLARLILLEPGAHRQKLRTQDFSISSPAPAPI